MVQIDGKVLGCGVILYSGEHFLLGERSDGYGWGLPGGKVEAGETYEFAIRRELLEEASVDSFGLTLLGEIEGKAFMRGKEKPFHSQIYLCQEFLITPRSLKRNDEMLGFKWVNISELDDLLEGKHWSIELFPPTKESLKLFKEYLGR